MAGSGFLAAPARPLPSFTSPVFPQRSRRHAHYETGKGERGLAPAADEAYPVGGIGIGGRPGSLGSGGLGVGAAGETACGQRPAGGPNEGGEGGEEIRSWGKRWVDRGDNWISLRVGGGLRSKI
jgi:hypothetical protein